MSDLRADLDKALAELATAKDALAAANVEMARRQNFTDAMLDTIEVGIVSCDAEGRNLVLNRAERARVDPAGEWQTLPTELAAAAIVDILDQDGHPLPVERWPLLRALRGEDVGAVELLLGPPGGPHHEVLSHTARIVGADGEVIGAVSALTDISRERAVARALAEAQRLGQLGSFEYDFATNVWTYSEQQCLLWGVEPEQMVPELMMPLILDEDREKAWDSWLSVSRLGGSANQEYRIRRASDGAERLIRTSVEVELGRDGEPVHAHGIQQDITDIAAAEMEARRATTFFEAVLSATPDYTCLLDTSTGAVVYSSRDVDELGMTLQDVQSLDRAARIALVHPDDQQRVENVPADARKLDDGQVLQLRYRAMHADGGWRWLNERVTPFRRDESGAVVELLVVLRDVTDVVEAEVRLAHGALHDDLTGLPNRTLLVDRLDTALARSGRDGIEVAVLFCDLDAFKRVNDTGGHAAGDAVLLEIARRLNSAVREGDTVARVGGDEFVIVVEPWNRSGEQSVPPELVGVPDRLLALRVAERVVEAVRAPIVVNGISHVVTASIGITYATLTMGENGHRMTADEVLQDADAAMYRAKGRGKDRYALFERGLRADQAERGRVEQALRSALQQRTGPFRAGAMLTPRPGVPSLTAAYQPIFDFGSGALVGFEALARLTDADGASIPPDVFIAVAEETGTIHPLGALMLELACSQLHGWREETAGLDHVVMSVNVSALQAHDASLGDDVRRVLTAHGLAPSDLVLELTETALLQAATSTITILRALQTDGVGIAIDDFGTGYASLRYLTTLPVTIIKIDRSFTSGLPHDETSRKIVKAVAGLAADLELGCIVEGVETGEQLSALPAGVQLQGYLTGRPAPPEALDLAGLVAGGWGG